MKLKITGRKIASTITTLNCVGHILRECSTLKANMIKYYD